jgi:O-antigen/teichoic acid export membrane protein
VSQTIKNMGWSTGSQIIGLVAGLAASAILARALGPEKFGMLSFFIALSYLCGPLAQLGLDLTLVRRIVHASGNRRAILASAVGLRIGAGIVAALLAVLAGGVLRGWAPDILAVSIPVALVLIIGSGGIAQSVFQGMRRWDLNFYTRLAGATSLLAFLAVCVFLESSIFGFAWARTIEALAISIVAIVFGCKILPRHEPSQNSPDIKQRDLALEGLPFLASALAVALYARVDQIMIGQLLGDQDLAIYSVAIQITFGWIALASVLVLTSRPSIIASAADPVELNGKIKSLFDVIVVFGLVVALANIAFGYLLIYVLFGEAYTDAYYLLIPLSLFVVFSALGGARTSYILGAKLDTVYAATTLTGMLVNVLLNFLLIPRLGIWGAIVASLVAQLFAVQLTCFVFPSLRAVGVIMAKSLVFPSCILHPAGMWRLLIQLRLTSSVVIG